MPDPVRTAAQLKRISDATADFRGRKYFQALVLCLTRYLDVRFALITETIADNPEHGQAIAFADGQSPHASFTYKLEDMPCKTVLGDVAVKVPCNAVELYPGAAEIDAYYGHPLKDNDGMVIGLVAIEHTSPVTRGDEIAAILRALSGRVAAELECARWRRPITPPPNLERT